MEFGSYKVLEELGRGGMGVVYLARQESLGRTVAIKVLPYTDAQLAARLDREVKALAALQSPHIVPIFDVGELDGRPYYTMAYCAGGSIADVVKSQGPLEPAQVVMVMSTVASALATMHAAGMVHRDVKTSNVLVTADGRPLVADLGLVANADGSRVTTSGALMGTLGSMAPELLDDAEPSAATDVFALGVLGYEIASGRQPFAGRSMSAVLDAVRRGQFPPLLDVAPGVPPELASLIERALSRDPADRPADLEQYSDQLTDVVKPVRLRPVQRDVATNATVHTDRRPDRPGVVEVEAEAPSKSGARRGRHLRTPLLLGAGAAAAVAIWVGTRSDNDGQSSKAAAIGVVELPGVEEGEGVSSESKWELLDDGRVRGTTVVTNNGDDGLVRHDEIIPKTIAGHHTEIQSTPKEDSVPEEDPVLRYCLSIDRGDTATVVWTADATDPAVTLEGLNALVDAWHTAATSWNDEHRDETCDDGPDTGSTLTGSTITDGSTTVSSTSTPEQDESSPTKRTTTTSTSSTTTTTTRPNRAPVAIVSPGAENICKNQRNYFDLGPGNGHPSTPLASDPDGDPLTYHITGYSRVYDVAGPDSADVVSFRYDSGSIAQTGVYISWRARDSRGAWSNTVTQTFNVFDC